MSITNGKSLRVLGFIKRICKEFNRLFCLKIFYCSLIRSLLEYETSIWNLSQQGLTDKIEKIQRQFLRLIYQLIVVMKLLPV